MSSFSEKEEKDKSGVDRRSFRERRMKLKMRRLIFGLILLIAVAAVIVVVIRSLSDRVYTDSELIGTVDWKPSGGATILPYGSDFISYSPDGIHCTDAHGKDLWSFSYVMQEPMVEVKGDYAAVADRNGRNIYIYDKSGLIGEINLSNPVLRIRLSAGGIVAAVLDDVNVTPIHLYYHDGSEISYFRTTMSRSGYPAAIGISDSGQLVAVSYVYVDNATLTSHVAFYNFGEVGKNETDNLVSAYDYREELVPMVEFMDENHSFALANDRLMLYEGGQKPTNVANILLDDEIRSVYYGEDYVGLVCYDREGESRYRMDVYDRKGEQRCRLHFNLDYNDIRISGNQIMIYNAASCAIYTVKGKLRYEGRFDASVYLMLPTRSDTRFTLVTDEGIQTVQLR